MTSKELKTRSQNIKNKVEKIEEHFAYGEIDKDLYDKILAKLKGEMTDLLEGLDQSKIIVSNPLEVIEKTLKSPQILPIYGV